jgi:hypothetical protein
MHRIERTDFVYGKMRVTKIAVAAGRKNCAAMRHSLACENPALYDALHASSRRIDKGETGRLS